MAVAQDIYDRVVESLVRHLKETGLTQEELADRCDLTQPTIQRLLSGRRRENLPFHTVLKIAVAFDVDLTSLLSPMPEDRQKRVQFLLAEINRLISANS